MDAEARAWELVEQYDAELRGLIPSGSDVFDAHLHLGTDLDGMIGDYEQLEQLMGRYDIARAFVFVVNVSCAVATYFHVLQTTRNSFCGACVLPIQSSLEGKSIVAILEIAPSSTKREYA